MTAFTPLKGPVFLKVTHGLALNVAEAPCPILQLGFPSQRVLASFSVMTVLAPRVTTVNVTAAARHGEFDVGRVARAEVRLLAPPQCHVRKKGPLTNGHTARGTFLFQGVLIASGDGRIGRGNHLDRRLEGYGPQALVNDALQFLLQPSVLPLLRLGAGGVAIGQIDQLCRSKYVWVREG